MTRISNSVFRPAVLVGATLVLLAACGPLPANTRIDIAYVTPAPPPRRVEVISRRPGADFVWITGYWRWDSRAYAWEPGRWERAPRRHARWSEGRWRHDRRGWYWQPGHWR